MKLRLGGRGQESEREGDRARERERVYEVLCASPPEYYVKTNARNKVNCTMAAPRRFSEGRRYGGERGALSPGFARLWKKKEA